ncbi:MAG: hypothetical protein JW939_01295, partial [Candidatus Thermoplasmatota archaeon]|nr:hypothetical protein [Candidatus Thermoplasmatota archaeon]
MSNNTRSRQRALLGGLVIIAVVLILMAVLLYPRDTPDDGDEFRREGPWRDLDGFKRSISEIDHFNYYEMEGPEGLEEITDPKNSVYLMIGLEVRVSSTDCVNIGNYLDRGGHVIIADDGTNAQNITDHLFGRAGGKVNFTGHRYLVDRLFTDPGGDTGYVVNMSFIKGDTFILGGARYELLLHS